MPISCFQLLRSQIPPKYSNKKNQTEQPSRPQCAMSACSLLQRPNLDWVFLEKKFNRREISNNSLIQFHIYIRYKILLNKEENLTQPPNRPHCVSSVDEL